MHFMHFIHTKGLHLKIITRTIMHNIYIMRYSYKHTTSYNIIATIQFICYTTI